MSQAAPESWDSVRARVAALVARREATLDETAAAWARFVRQAGWSRGDVEALWDGLTEDLVRRYVKGGGSAADTTRADVLAAMAALRERVLKDLST